jgi:sugar phosphate isomerase/epimerase
LNISSVNDAVRKKSIERYYEYIDAAYACGSKTILINSGKRSDSNEDIKLGLFLLKDSINMLLKYSMHHAGDYLLDISLEPGDICVDFCELIGGTDTAVNLAKDIRENHLNFYLTLDTSHLRQLGEIPACSIEKAMNYCHHIHLANCLLKDKNSDLYGDKHPEFGLENSEFDYSDIKEIYNKLEDIYRSNNVLTGLEIISRQKNEIELFERTVKNMPWFFSS